jgi:hypothetical protein
MFHDNGDLIELDIDEEECVPINGYLWDIMLLNNMPIPYEGQSEESWMHDGDAMSDIERMSTWHRVFNVDHTNEIQVCYPRIRQDNVISVNKTNPVW